MKGVLGVIPARFASTRFPGKPLATILGKPMVEWVYRSAQKALSRVIVATDDERIVKAVKSFGGEAMLTPTRCPTGTDRMAWVARRIKAGYYVNIQGDEPMMHPGAIAGAVRLAVQKKSAATSAVELKDKPAASPHVVKVVLDKEGKALYFSRSLIPFRGHGVKSGQRILKHLGLYVYPREVLFKFIGLKPPLIEQTEKLEQLRALYHGIPIFVHITSHDSFGVDTPGDLKFVEKNLIGRRN